MSLDPARDPDPVTAPSHFLFEREHHRRIARVLDALDAQLLEHNGCLFGGGTAIALTHGEYRDSMNIDSPKLR